MLTGEMHPADQFCSSGLGDIGPTSIGVDDCGATGGMCGGIGGGPV